MESPVNLMQLQFDVIQTVNAIFNTTDRQEWHSCQDLFADEVLLDYESLSGQAPIRLAPSQIISAWQQVLPGFAFTQHMLSNHEVSVIGADQVSCVCKGHAVHYIPNAVGGEEWGVYGTYRFELVRHPGGWKVSTMQYNHKFAHGNLKLGELASERVRQYNQ
ncbi:nuclear transport factor 2 family protein [Spirosoma fluviale]|uniref:SnoaL-like domain-containing protein n=1 Tax=Spirosoma fluviale TaxID=1597977 RepID=A0A286G9M0_9BACT|nr:nuclear transport factor 2 family protein [Spirosoma fluviale]SOD92172.1 SnoaL-like domain-containing protein [Spirosoma fluviale]